MLAPSLEPLLLRQLDFSAVAVDNSPLMPRRAAGREGQGQRYWNTRLRSSAFKRALTGIATAELRALARQRVGDVLDPVFVRTLIRELDARVIDRAIVADLVVETRRRVAARLQRQRRSLLDLVDPQLVAEIEADRKRRRVGKGGGAWWRAAVGEGRE